MEKSTTLKVSYNEESSPFTQSISSILHFKLSIERSIMYPENWTGDEDRMLCQ